MNCNVKGVVLAGGLGTRLYPLTRRTAKCMLLVNGKPLLEHVIRYMVSYGIKEIVLTVGYKRKQIMDHFGNGQHLGVKIHYSLETKPLGTAGSFRNASRFIDSTVVVIQGDNLTNFDLNRIVSFHRTKKALATIVLTSISNPKGFGLARIDRNNRIIRFEEKPARRFSNLINSGLYILDPKVLSHIPKNKMFDFSTDLFPLLLKEKLPLFGVIVKGYWLDVGTPEAYNEANQFYKGVHNASGNPLISG